MGIVYMDKRVDRFMTQLELTEGKIVPNPQHFHYQEKEGIYLYDVEQVINLLDFEILFGLIISQTGVYTPEGGLCQREDFIADATEIEIEDLRVFDNVYGEDLRFNREEFTEIVNKVRTLIEA